MSAKPKNKRRKPLYVARSGNVKVAVQSSKSNKPDGTVYPGYRLNYYDAQKKRCQPYFPDFNVAIGEADKVARDLALGVHSSQTSGGSLSKEEVADYRRLQNLVTDLDGRSLFDFLTRDAIPALLTLKSCGFNSLSDAANYYCRGFKGKPNMTVADAIAIALAQKNPDWAPKTYNDHKRAWEMLSKTYGSKSIRDLDITDVADVLLRVSGRPSTKAVAATVTVKKPVLIIPIKNLSPSEVDADHVASQQTDEMTPVQI